MRGVGARFGFGLGNLRTARASVVRLALGPLPPTHPKPRFAKDYSRANEAGGFRYENGRDTATTRCFGIQPGSSLVRLRSARSGSDGRPSTTLWSSNLSTSASADSGERDANGLDSPAGDAVDASKGEEDIVLGVYHVREVTKDDVEVKFIRSGGAGGQNVNKVNTKADVRLKIEQQDWIPTEVKKQLFRREKNRINKEGELVVSSTKHRTQKKNLEDAMGKMQRFLQGAVESLLPIEANPVKEKRMKKKLRAANEKRLDNKKKHAMKKKERRRKDW